MPCSSRSRGLEIPYLQVGSQAAVHGIECEVSSPGAVQRLAKAAISQFGSIDVWINNAGYSGRYQVRLQVLVKK